MSDGQAPKLVALYFPQLHRIPENDQWWGDGFTDWDNVRKAEPLYDGHDQPRRPLDGYYDQSKIETLRRQVEQAKAANIFGFSLYHYWFDGTVLLDRPAKLLLENPDIDMPFCLSWANETWSRRWDGRDHEILIQQTHPADVDRWRLHFDYLLPFLQDERAIRIDDEPVFIIYRPQNIAEIDDMIGHWRRWATEAGLPGLHLMFQKQYQLPDESCLRSFDSLFQFQPFESMDRSSAHNDRVGARRTAARVKHKARRAVDALVSKPTRIDYDEAWRRILDRPYDHASLTVHPGAFVDWDNTPRYGRRATIFDGASPERFEYWMARLLTSPHGRDAEFIFINAWNEWAEGAYLEPDRSSGSLYLEALRRVSDPTTAP